MSEYKESLDKADEAAVFYSMHALELKRMPLLSKESVKNGFSKKGLQVFNKRSELEAWLNTLNYKNSITIFMSSGNYDGVNTEDFANRITQAVY